MASEALAARELTRNDLRRHYVKLHRNVYVSNSVSLTARDRAYAAWLWSGRNAVVAGTSAAAMHGARWLPSTPPAELTRVRCGAPSGIVIHRETLQDGEVCLVQSIDCTTVARTAFDMGRRIPGDDAVIRIDALLNATRCPRRTPAPRDAGPHEGFPRQGPTSDRYGLAGLPSRRRVRRGTSLARSGDACRGHHQTGVLGSPRLDHRAGERTRRPDRAWTRLHLGQTLLLGLHVEIRCRP